MQFRSLDPNSEALVALAFNPIRGCHHYATFYPELRTGLITFKTPSGLGFRAFPVVVSIHIKPSLFLVLIARHNTARGIALPDKSEFPACQPHQYFEIKTH